MNLSFYSWEKALYARRHAKSKKHTWEAAWTVTELLLRRGEWRFLAVLFFRRLPSRVPQLRLSFTCARRRWIRGRQKSRSMGHFIRGPARTSGYGKHTRSRANTESQNASR